MGFIKRRGKTKFVYLPVTPSTVLAENSLVTFASGKLIAAIAATPADELSGIIRHAITANDADYASDRLVEVEVPVEKNVEYQFDTTGLVAADVGKDVDLTDASTVNRAAVAIGVVKPLKVESTTRGVGLLKINNSY